MHSNCKKAEEQNLTNVTFVDYDGVAFPFEDNMFDMIVTRYALHHFPRIEETFKEIARVLKQNGQLFISDPTLNDNDVNGFVNDYMQIKQDGHIKFYTENEFITYANNVGLQLEKSFRTKIRFQRRNSDKYGLLLSMISDEVKNGYEVELVNDEIFITEQVLNLSFIKL